MSSEASSRVVLPIEVGPVAITVDATAVREVLGPVAVTRLAGGPPALVGVLPWGGRAVAVLDVSTLVGIDEALERARTVVLDVAGAVVALPVDRVREPRVVTEERPSHASRVAFAPSEVDVDGRAHPLLDVAQWVGSLVGTSA